ncbi:TPA: hypothetical protein L4V12_004639 [Pseudomonas aeruginosa]|nr:hypothetical protein [Pseudomonas aeruginosa]
MSTFFQEYTSGLTARADQLEHERDLLGQALGECIEAAGITNPGVALTGPQLLLFAEDLKAHIGGLRGQLADTAVPMQPLVKDAHGVARFKANKIVNHLLDYASERGCGMTELAKLQFPEEDYMQFAQLIGYSVSGYSDLSYVSDDSRGMAYAKLESLINDPSAQTQPSPAPTLRAAIDVANDRFEVPVAKWGTDLVGEEERPEVVAYFDRNYPSTGDAFIWANYEGSPYEPVMTVAQHARIVGALRADRDSWAEQAEQRLADWDEMRKERDAALARVAELEQKSAGSWTVDTSCGRPILMYEGCSVIEDQTAYEVIRMIKWIGELERQEPVATVAKVPGEDWNSLDFHRDLQDMQPGTKLYAAPVAQAQQLHDLDKQCRDDVARALGLRPNQERGFAWSYLLASIKSCVKASGDSAQAQHSVPESVRAWFEAKQAHVNAVDAYNARLKFVREHCPFGTSVDPEYQLMEEADRLARGLVGPMFDELRSLLAAAPGKEGV